MQIAMIPKGTTHVYWKSVQAGAEKAAKELAGVAAKGIAQLNPLSFIADGLRGVIIDQVDVADVAKALAGIAVVGAVGIGLSALTLRRRVQTG